MKHLNDFKRFQNLIISPGIVSIILLIGSYPAIAGDTVFSKNTKLTVLFDNILPPPLDSRQIRLSGKGKIPGKHLHTKNFIKSELDLCLSLLRGTDVIQLNNPEFNNKLNFISFKNASDLFITKFKKLKIESDQLLDEQNIRANEGLNKSTDIAKEFKGNKPIPRAFSTIKDDLWATQDIILKNYEKIYSEFKPILGKTLLDFDDLYSLTNNVQLQRYRFELLKVLYSLHNLHEQYWINFYVGLYG